MNFLPVQGASDTALEVPGGLLRWPRAQGVAADHIATIGVRPEHLQFADQTDGFALIGEVDTIEQLGDTSVAYINVPGMREPLSMKIGVAGGVPVRGEQVKLGAEPQHLLAFDAEGRYVQA